MRRFAVYSLRDQSCHLRYQLVYLCATDVLLIYRRNSRGAAGAHDVWFAILSRPLLENLPLWRQSTQAAKRDQWQGGWPIRGAYRLAKCRMRGREQCRAGCQANVGSLRQPSIMVNMSVMVERQSYLLLRAFLHILEHVGSLIKGLD